MHDPLLTNLLLLRQRIESLYDARPEGEEDFQNGLNFAVSGIEQAIGAVGGGRTRWPDAGSSLDGVHRSVARLHVLLEARDVAADARTATRLRVALAHHLLEQACALLAND